MNKLDIHTFPLQGASLIEASAGTGKTYTINQLYRRIVLGHGDAPRVGELPPDCTQILVVTFTRAATEELRGRIRAGLRDTFEQLLLLDNGNAQDDDLKRWLSEMNAATPADWQTLRERLQLSLAQMDEASIFTIHKFCAQMLKRFAFDSGVGFNLALETEGGEYLRRACEDVWRQFCYPQSRDVLAFTTKTMKNPDDLLRYYRSWLSRPTLKTIPDVSTGFSSAWRFVREAFDRARNLWNQLGSDGISDQINASGVNKKSYSKRNLPNWMTQVGDYFAAEEPLPLPANLYRFEASELSAKTESGAAPEHALFEAIDELCNSAGHVAMALELHWFREVFARYLELLQQAQVITSDDLLRLLDEALQSERGAELAAQIRRLYPVAMIDEFQDTDPVQYRIFSTLYPQTNDPEPGHALIMIGDPKQAIYAFRGADVFTYMTARTRIDAARTFTLDTNYRSHSRLIEATNKFWANRDKPFVFDKHIDFYPVRAGGQHDKKAPKWAPGIADTPLQLWLSDAEENKNAAMSRIASECAGQIAALLAGAASWPGKGRARTPVIAGDIAVLVYSRTQAAIIRDALTAENIGSVYLTRDSVFQSQEALDLLIIMEAVAHPGNESGVRRALATTSWGCSADDLVAMQQDESRWETQLAALHNYQHIWARRGIMAMLMQWLEDGQRAVRLRRLGNGERILTNVLHLGELLQAQSRRVRGHAALIRWFSERLDPEEMHGEETQLRLETDDRLVTIVTIHKSKGLEYPFVFLPYLWADPATPSSQNSETLYYDGTEVVRDLQPDDQARAAQRRDILAEKMRLLYVALTRAKFGCYLWLSGAVNGKTKKPFWPESALGYLLNTENPAALVIDGMYCGELPQWNAHSQQELDVPPPPVTTAVYRGRPREAWRVGSYSQLAAHSAQDAEQSAADLGHYFDWEAGLSQPVVATGALPLALKFPKGANPGTCLHAIYEHWDFRDDAALLAICEQQLALYGLTDQPPAEVAQWIAATVRQPLALYDTDVCLADIPLATRLDEMEFYLPVGQLTPGEVNTLLGNDARFQFEPLTGYLKGFIDLIFEWQGRYYVADYKSNYLGDTWQDYQPEGLRTSMREHRYDLQSWIYMLALDQLLSRRLPGYQPQKHLGGSVYLYLRGMGDHFTGADPDCGVCFTPVNVEALRRWRAAVLPGESADA